MKQESQKHLQGPSKTFLKSLKPLVEKIKSLEPIEQNIKAKYNVDGDSCAIRDICRQKGCKDELTQLQDLADARFFRCRLLFEFSRCLKIHPKVPLIESPKLTFSYVGIFIFISLEYC